MKLPDKNGVWLNKRGKAVPTWYLSLLVPAGDSSGRQVYAWEPDGHLVWAGPVPANQTAAQHYRLWRAWRRWRGEQSPVVSHFTEY